MDLLKQTKETCNLYNIKPARSKGQNFLVSKSVYEKIIQTANINKTDNVLEIGPGCGFLTFKLAEIAKKVVSVELDDNLAYLLKNRVKTENINNVEIINKDVLKIDISSIFSEDFKIVANIPYNISSIFLRKIFDGEIKPRTTTLLMQKEVAQRIMAHPGDMSLLAVSVQYYNSEIKIAKMIKSGNFWPKPRVDSAIINMKLKNNFPQIDTDLFFKFVRIGFSSKRKMLKNNLIKILKIDNHTILSMFKSMKMNENIRAQELSVAEWVGMFVKLNLEKIIKL